jgi:hypothetical protein
MNLKHIISRNFLPLATVLLLGATGAAHAATLTYDSATVVDQEFVTITDPPAVTVPRGGSVFVGAGQIQLQIGSATLPAWCVDLLNQLSTSSTTLTISSLTTAGVGGGNPTLTSTQIGQIGALMVHGNALVTANPGTNVSAAIQLAIWSVEYTGLSFDDANFYPGLPALVTTYLGNVSGVNPLWAPVLNVTLLSDSPGNQSLGFVTPIPGALPLFITGLGLLGAGIARRKKKHSVSLAN